MSWTRNSDLNSAATDLASDLDSDSAVAGLVTSLGPGHQTFDVHIQGGPKK